MKNLKNILSNTELKIAVVIVIFTAFLFSLTIEKSYTYNGVSLITTDDSTKIEIPWELKYDMLVIQDIIQHEKSKRQFDTIMDNMVHVYYLDHNRITNYQLSTLVINSEYEHGYLKSSYDFVDSVKDAENENMYRVINQMMLNQLKSGTYGL